MPIYIYKDYPTLEEFLELTFNGGTKRCRYAWFEKYNFLHHYNEIMERTKFLDKDSNLIHRVYCVIHKIKEQPKCVICGNNSSILSIGYSKTCSDKCRNKLSYEKSNITII